VEVDYIVRQQNSEGQSNIYLVYFNQYEYIQLMQIYLGGINWKGRAQRMSVNSIYSNYRTLFRKMIKISTVISKHEPYRKYIKIGMCYSMIFVLQDFVD